MDPLQAGQPSAPAGGAGAPPISPPASPAAPPAAPVAPPAPAAPVFNSGPSPSLPAPSGAPAAPAGGAAAWTSVRDALKDAYGVDLSHLPDDRSALQHLVSEAAQGRQYADAGAKYLQHATDFEQYLAQRQAQQQQAANQPKPSWWNPPEWKPEWNALLKLDPQTGRPAAGSDPALASKFLAYQGYRQQWADRLLDNPAEALKPLISEQAQAIAQKMVQEHLGGYQEKVWADSYVQQNSQWLHQRDQGGNVQMVADPRTGMATPKLSPLGVRFRDYVVAAHRSGVGNLEAQQQFARAMLERDLLSANYQLQQAGRQPGGPQQPAAPVRTPDYSGTLQPATANAPGQLPQNPTLSLRDQLANEFKRHGITEADLAQPPRPLQNA